MEKHYEELVEGIDKMGAALISIGKTGDNKPIKLLVARLIGKLGFNDPEIGDDIAMIRFAVENDDESLEKLTANITGSELAPAAIVETTEPEKKEEETETSETSKVN